MYAVFGFGLLRFVRYHHCSISMSVYCTAMYKLCDCWKKNMKNLVSREIVCVFTVPITRFYPDVITG